MRWILFILFCLLGAPAHAVSIPGVTTTTTTDSTTEPAPEPDIEQKKAAYGALADVLDNDTSRKELIDQLRTVAATPPAENSAADAGRRANRAAKGHRSQPPLW